MSLPGLHSIAKPEGQEALGLGGLLLLGGGMQDTLWPYCSSSPVIPNQLTFLQLFRDLLWLSSAPISGFIAGLSRENGSILSHLYWKFPYESASIMFSLLIFSQFFSFHYISGYFNLMPD